MPTTVLLRALGFRKTGRTYNRRVDDGLVHVVNFQMGQFPIGEYALPGIRESFYGRFCVNLGVYLPCVPEIEYGRAPAKTIHEYHCEIRDRLGALAFAAKDVWWDLDSKVGETAGLVCRLMDEYGIPFLDEYLNYDAVLAHFEAHGALPFHNRGRSALAAAMVCHHLGRSEQERRYFEIAESEGAAMKREGFLGHVAAVRANCGV